MIKPKGLRVGWSAFASVFAILAPVLLALLLGVKAWIGVILVFWCLTIVMCTILRIASDRHRSEIARSLTGY